MFEEAFAEYEPEPTVLSLRQWLADDKAFVRPKRRPVIAPASRRRREQTTPATAKRILPRTGWGRVAWMTTALAVPLIVVVLAVRGLQRNSATDLAAPADPPIPPASVQPSSHPDTTTPSNPESTANASTGEAALGPPRVSSDPPVAMMLPVNDQGTGTESADTGAVATRPIAVADSLQDNPPDGDSTLLVVPPTPLSGAAHIIAAPWASVFVDDQYMGDTPLPGTVTLTAGAHRIRFENPMFPSVEIERTIVAADTTEIAVSLWQSVGQVQLSVSPWAILSVNEQVRDTIPPLDAPLVVSPGSNRLLLHHPELGDWTHTLNVVAGSTYVLKFNLYELLAK
jgi:hypothetical protein